MPGCLYTTFIIFVTFCVECAGAPKWVPPALLLIALCLSWIEDAIRSLKL